MYLSGACYPDVHHHGNMMHMVMTYLHAAWHASLQKSRMVMAYAVRMLLCKHPYYLLSSNTSFSFLTIVRLQCGFF